MASGCFPFKRRLPWMPSDPTSLTSAETDRGSPLTRLFRSKSDMDVKRSSYKMMTSLSEIDVRRSSDCRQSNPSARRYRRVLRDVAPSGDGCFSDNPNVVHKFSQEYLEKRNIDKASADQFGSRKLLPYEVTGSTILKKPLVLDSGVRIAPNRPTISFGNEVEVIEYDKKEKVKVKSSCLRRVQLSMDEDTKCMIDETTDNDPEKENCQSDASLGNTVLKQWE